MAETLILSLRCIDALPGSCLRSIAITISNVLQVKIWGVRRFVVCNPLTVRLLRRTLPTRWEI